MVENTRFEKDEKTKNVSIYFNNKKIGNVNDKNKFELFTRKNKAYVDEFKSMMEKQNKNMNLMNIWKK